VLLTIETVLGVANLHLFGMASYVPERGRLIHVSKRKNQVSLLICSFKVDVYILHILDPKLLGGAYLVVTPLLM